MIKDTTKTRRKITESFPIPAIGHYKEKVLNWLNQFDTFCFLDNHEYAIPPHSFECLCAAGVEDSIEVKGGVALDLLQAFIDRSTDRYLFGHLGYDLKNEIGQLSSTHSDPVGFPDLFFFEPQILLWMNDQEITIQADDPQIVFNEINRGNKKKSGVPSSPPTTKSRFTKDEYISVIRKLKEHILRGDCYEINFCQEFFLEKITIDPVAAYLDLSKISPNPFSALYRLKDQWLIGASPERFLKKEGSKIISQPIKGTSKRETGDRVKDNARKEELLQSAKDRAENVMVVDLVRNDLARICKEGTVKVDELYGIYSFPQVHQMISTVSGDLEEGIRFTDMIRACFPMGSMTGAPKKRVMELIEKYEKTKRGLFSGALGYISPDGFDFNVVIRSMLYNSATGYLSFPAGSGITFYSDPEKEWEECRMKAEAIRHVLEKTS
ncbi:MAG TPA: anthranilate synthase component I family protein [Chitinophagaceae bacterium]|nr:anthranilate synthase component I family protein [Chitinophagaceae bacterium]